MNFRRSKAQTKQINMQVNLSADMIGFKEGAIMCL